MRADTILTVMIPVGVYCLGLYLIYTFMTHTLDRFHLLLIAITAVFLIAPVLLAGAGLSMAWCLLVLALSPWVTVVGYEVRGHAHNARMLEAMRHESAS